MRPVALFFALPLLFVACAQGVEDDVPLPQFDPDAGSHPDAHVLPHDASPAGDSASQGDTSVPGDDASSGDDSATGDDAASGDDSSTSDSGGADTGGTDSGSVARPTQGEVLISEVMYNPSGTEPDTEWFEVTNVASSPRDLGGLTMVDGASTPNSETIAGHVVVQPGAYAVLINTKAAAGTVPAASIAYKYSLLTLVNGTGGTVVLKDGANVIAQAPYGGFAMSVNGASNQLKNLTFADESTKASWCTSSNAWSGSTDKGTPGAASDCP